MQTYLIFEFDFFFFSPFRKHTWAELVQTQASWVMIQPGRFKLFWETALTWEPSGKREKMGVARLGSCKSAWYGISVHRFGNTWLTKSWNRKEDDKIYLSKSILIEQLPKCVRCCWVSCLHFKCLITLSENTPFWQWKIVQLLSSRFHLNFHNLSSLHFWNILK